MKMSLGVLRPRNKALRDNIDQNYELLLLYYSNRSRSLVCCTFARSLARSPTRLLAHEYTTLSRWYITAGVFFIHYNDGLVCLKIAIFFTAKIIPTKYRMWPARVYLKFKHRRSVRARYPCATAR